ncbi:MAG TPA: hypothetical protein VF079_11525 [Sphingomicrobium sp.]
MAIILASFSDGGLHIVRQVHDGVTVFQRADVKPEKLVVINAVEYRGRFVRNGSCLELVSDGKRYTPLFNNPTEMQEALRDSRIHETSRHWSIAGGPMVGRSSVSAGTLGDCRSPLFAVVSISDPRAGPHA